MKRKWLVYESKVLNVIPDNDIQEHAFHIGCPCKPTLQIENGFMIITHNSYDKREALEHLVNLAWDYQN